MTAESSVLTTEEQILAALKGAGGRLPLADLLVRFSTENRPVAELKAMALVKEGTLSMERTEAGYALTLSKKCVVQSHGRNPAPTKPKRNTRLTVTATIPFSTQRGSGSLGIANTEEVFENLLKNARRYVKLSLPFPEEAIVVRFASLIAELARLQVRIQVLTREVFSSRSDGLNYPMLHKSLMRLWDIYRARGNEQLFEIRDFHRYIGSRMKSMHYESTHAKILSVDGKECYVGSAEFRLNSIYNNFELGFAISGDEVVRVENVYDLMWRHAKPVRYSDICSVINTRMKTFKG